MCFFISLILATFWLVIGYAVLFMSSKADGQVQKFGHVVANLGLLDRSTLPPYGVSDHAW